MDICRREVPPMTEVAPGHRVACFARRPGWRRHDAPLLEVDDVEHDLFAAAACWRAEQRRAVDDVSFALDAGQAGDLHDHRRVGQRQDHARPHDPQHRAAERRRDPLPRHRRRRTSAARATRLDFMRQVQPIFQNPFEAFNPLKRVDRYLFMTARRFAGARDAAPRSKPRPTRRCARSACRWPRCAAASRTSCRAASCSASRSRAR